MAINLDNYAHAKRDVCDQLGHEWKQYRTTQGGKAYAKCWRCGRRRDDTK